MNLQEAMDIIITEVQAITPTGSAHAMWKRDQLDMLAKLRKALSDD